MPRLPHSLLTKAYAKSPLLPIVLRGTRDFELALNELRWLSEHVSSSSKAATLSSPQRKSLLKLCRRREKGEPLQYILGSQPFGPLDLKCRKGVLIPRPETEAYVTHLANLLCEGKLQQKLGFQFSPEVIRRREQNHRKPLKLRVLDVCSGSGCISLLLHALISKQFPYLHIRGVDISGDAIDLAKENEARNKRTGIIQNSSNDWGSQSPQVEFVQQDVLRGDVAGTSYDIIISNPPYISQRKFLSQTTRSVRNYEPKLALVPPWAKSPPPGFPPQEDIFYHRLVDMHQTHQSKVTLMEVGDAEQAVRVVNHILNIKALARWNHVELWRDYPGQEPDRRKLRMLHVGEKVVPIKGQGKIRSVVIFRNIEWRKPRAQIEGIHRRFYDQREQPEELAPLTVGGFGNRANQAQKWRMDWRQERAYITTREEKIRENRRRSLVEEKNKSERTRRTVWTKKGGQKVVRLRVSRRTSKPLMGKNPRGIDV